MGFATDCIHAGQEPDPTTGAIITPIYQTSTYVQQGIGQHKGYEYARTQNPTRRALEKNLAALEGGTDAYCYASGMAATHAVLSLIKPGQRVVVSDNVYGGTHRLFTRLLADYGVRFAPPGPGGRPGRPLHHQVPQRPLRQRGRRGDREGREARAVAAVLSERRRRHPLALRFVARAARDQDAGPAHAASRGERARGGRVPPRAGEGPQGALAGLPRPSRPRRAQATGQRLRGAHLLRPR